LQKAIDSVSRTSLGQILPSRIYPSPSDATAKGGEMSGIIESNPPFKVAESFPNFMFELYKIPGHVHTMAAHFDQWFRNIRH
jgi:hypothetical protein